MIKPNELRNMTIDEIKEKVHALKKELFDVRNQGLSGRIEKPHRISDMKKDIARCQTIIREKANVPAT